MMNHFVSGFLLFVASGGVMMTLLVSANEDENQPGKQKMTFHHLPKDSLVAQLLQQQVAAELDASMVYLAMAAHFGSENKNRPGFYKFFKEAAQEEFEHAQKFIDYLNKRGIHLTKPHFNIKGPGAFSWKHGLEALEHALELEGKVTEKIQKIHKQAGGDGHLTNFLEEEFLNEQVDSMRLLSGYVHNLRDMAKQASGTYDMLSEYLFDLQLQGKKVTP